MIAIETRLIKQTNYKPSRIVAETCNGQRLVMSKDKAEDESKEAGINCERAQQYVAQQLANKMNWPGTLIGGSTKRGMCFVFAN